jgi:O-acetylhomoserine/O-acetylserine sulfhydrylase-like pyridoxal-dependent enzyme
VEKKSVDCSTAVIRAGQHPDRLFGGVSMPILQSSTFAFKDAEHGAELCNPTTKVPPDGANF